LGFEKAGQACYNPPLYIGEASVQRRLGLQKKSDLERDGGIMRFLLVCVSVAVLIMFALSCSTAEKKYMGIQKLEDSKLQLLQRDTDYDVKLRACDDMIMSLNEFLGRYKKGRWHDTALLSLAEWQNKKQSIMAREAYDKLQVALASSEQVMSATYDYDIKIQNCDDAINAIQNFLQSYDQTELGAPLQTTLIAWQQRKSACNEEFNSLDEELFNLCKAKAIDVAEAQHSMSYVETINLASQKKTKDGNKVILNNAFDVRMRGSVIGKHIFKLKVFVDGYFAMDTKKVGVYDNARVEE
jgi:hypothetical protein